jgi:DNA-directed RNA polymerase II subunit RPB2
VKVRQNRKYIPGDKLASRYSQKGTISRILPARELPRVSTGPLKSMVPDILINPHSQPSRMTMNKIIEILVNKAACINGKFYNATTFRNFEKELDEVQNTLKNYGLDPMGNENFEFPDGSPLKTKVFFGPCFYQALRHHVNDKIQMRSRKGVKPSTRQPMSGRSNEGGLKVGEMERDALVSHGSSALLRERLCDVSDVYNLPVCQCGVIAITNHEEKLYKCTACGPNTKIGVIRIPYVVKLLLHWLNVAGIHMKFKVSEVVSMGGRPEEKYLL